MEAGILIRCSHFGFFFALFAEYQISINCFCCRYGFLGKRFKDFCGNILGPILTGLVGHKKPRYHGVPYSLTEEFVSVYRMHSLLPDKLIVRDIQSTDSEDKCPPILEEYIPLNFPLNSLYISTSTRTKSFFLFRVYARLYVLLYVTGCL